MSETINHQLPPQGQSVDQLMAQDLIEGHMGGNRKGGVIEFGLDSTPITSRENGFKIGELPADLLMVVSPGGDIEADGINAMGIVRSRHVGNNTDADNIDLVKLGKDDHGNYFVAEDVSKRPNAVGLSVDNPLKIGRSTENTIPELELTTDISMSAGHLSVELLRSGVVKVADLNSSNGTGIKLMGEVDKFTQENSHEGTFELREDLKRSKRNASIGAAALSSVEFPQKSDLVDTVPKTAEEAKEAMEESELIRLKERYGPQLESLNDRLNELTEGLSIDDMLELRAYHNGVELINKGWEQGQDGIDHTSVGEQTKVGSYNKMSKDAQKVASSWANTYIQYESVQKLMQLR
jgi:hypothetical protein